MKTHQTFPRGRFGVIIQESKEKLRQLYAYIIHMAVTTLEKNNEFSQSDHAVLVHQFS